MSIIRIYFVICVTLALFGCSDAPSASQARAKLEAQIQQQSNGLIRLVTFEKTDGVMQELLGMKGYAMSYSAEIEFVEDCMWSGGNDLFGWDGSFRADRSLAPAKGALSDFFYKSQGVKPAKKGQHLKFSSKITFEKSERGWR